MIYLKMDRLTRDLEFLTYIQTIGLSKKSVEPYNKLKKNLIGIKAELLKEFTNSVNEYKQAFPKPEHEGENPELIIKSLFTPQGKKPNVEPNSEPLLNTLQRLYSAGDNFELSIQSIDGIDGKQILDTDTKDTDAQNLERYMGMASGIDIDNGIDMNSTLDIDIENGIDMISTLDIDIDNDIDMISTVDTLRKNFANSLDNGIDMISTLDTLRKKFENSVDIAGTLYSPPNTQIEDTIRKLYQDTILVLKGPKGFKGSKGLLDAVKQGNNNNYLTTIVLGEGTYNINNYLK